MSLLLIALLPFLGALLPALLIRVGRDSCAWSAAVVTGTALLGLLIHAPVIFSGGVVTYRLDWLPGVGLQANFLLDGLSFLFAGLILGIGLLIIVYARFYLDRRDPMGQFYTYLLLFQGAMTGIVVNGQPRDLDGVPLHTNALDFLRGCGLTGAKEGCAEGECGACSVLVARPAPDGSDATEWTAINSCLVPAAALDGQEVVTSEGLGAPDGLHPVQREMAVRGGSQCGYCTPGFVCSMAAEFYRTGRAATNGTGPAAGHDHDHRRHSDRGWQRGQRAGRHGRYGRHPLRLQESAARSDEWARAVRGERLHAPPQGIGLRQRRGTAGDWGSRRRWSARPARLAASRGGRAVHVTWRLRSIPVGLLRQRRRTDPVLSLGLRGRRRLRRGPDLYLQQ